MFYGASALLIHITYWMRFCRFLIHECDFSVRFIYGLKSVVENQTRETAFQFALSHANIRLRNAMRFSSLTHMKFICICKLQLIVNSSSNTTPHHILIDKCTHLIYQRKHSDSNPFSLSCHFFFFFCRNSNAMLSFSSFFHFAIVAALEKNPDNISIMLMLMLMLSSF